MDKVDKEILNLIQTGFPIEGRPFKAIGEKVGLGEEEEVLRRIASFKEEGLMRRLGASFNSQKLGYVSTLCAAKVSQTKVAKVAQAINVYPGVTHNYLRESNSYNLWFTLHAENKKRLEEILEEIKKKTGLPEILNFPALKMFKIKVEFPF